MILEQSRKGIRDGMWRIFLSNQNIYKQILRAETSSLPSTKNGAGFPSLCGCSFSLPLPLICLWTFHRFKFRTSVCRRARAEMILASEEPFFSHLCYCRCSRSGGSKRYMNPPFRATQTHSTSIHPIHQSFKGKEFAQAARKTIKRC